MIETFMSLSRAAGHDLAATLGDGRPSIPAGSRRDVGSLADGRIGSSVYNLLAAGASTYTGRPVSPATSMQHNTVYGCVAKIAKSVASCPLVTHRNKFSEGPNGEPVQTKSLAFDDYRYRLLREQPNPEMSSFNWREAMVLHLLLWGNHYSYIEWDGAGRARAIWPLEPAYVQVLRTRTSGELVYRYFPHNPYSVPVQPGIYLSQDILHIPYLGFDGVVGFSPITLLRQSLGLFLAAQEYRGRFFANGGKPPYWIEFPGQVDDPTKFLEKYRQVTGALENSGRAPLVYGGMKLNEMKMSPEDAQFVEGMNFDVSEVCRIFDMPLYMMGDPGGKASTYASAEQANIYYAQHTVAPVCERVEQKMNMTVLGSNDALTCRHDMRALYRGDMKTTAEAHAREIASGEITPNQARIESDRNPGPPELDTHFMQGAMATVEFIVKNGHGGGAAAPAIEPKQEAA